jgi:hypothetical protein
MKGQIVAEKCITSLQACMPRASSWISSQGWRPSCASRCRILKMQNLNQMAHEWKKLLLDTMLSSMLPCLALLRWGR